MLQNATDIITRCDNYFITKFEKGFLLNVSGVLLQDAKVLLQNLSEDAMCIGYEVEQIQGDISRRDVNLENLWLDMNFPFNFI